MKVVTPAGEVIELGSTETAPTIGITDYSRRVTDDFGVTTVVQRNFARRMSVKLAVPSGEVDALQRRLADLRATAAQWIADDRFSSLNVRGFYKDFQLDLAVGAISYCTLSVEGLAEAAPVPDSGVDPAPDGAVSVFQLLQPATVTDAALASTTIAEDDAPEWSAGTTYPAGARVIRGALHRVFESLAAGNIGNDPAGVGKWLDLGPTNRWAMFDQALGTVSTATDAIVVTIDAAGVDAVALLDIKAATVRVQAAGYDRLQIVGAGAVTFVDLPVGAGAVTVRVAGNGTVSVGTLLVGRRVGLGSTEASPTAGITDYSRKVTDDFGDVTVVERAWAKRMTARTLIRTDAVDVVAGRLAAVRARPSLWIGQAGLDCLTVYGFFKDFSIEVTHNVSKLSLSIEGLSVAAPIRPLATSVAWPDITDPTGTKPRDNATNGAPAGSPVAGRDAAQVIADADALADESIDQLLRLNGYAETLDLRTLIEGQPMGLFAIQQRSAREEGDAFIQATIDILGAKSPDGSGFVLSGSNVKLSPTLSLAGFVESTRVSLDGLTADTDFVRQVLIDPSGANAKILLTSNVNGHVSGIYNTNDGNTGKFIIAADEFGIADPNGGQAFFPLYYADGLLKMTNVEIDTLAVGSVTITSIAAGAITGGAVTGYSAAVVDGSGSAPSSNMIDVVTVGFYASAACRVEMTYDAGLAYNGDADFGADIQVNFGASYAGVSAGAGNTTPSFGRGASVQLAGGAYHTFKFRWRGSAGVKLLSRARLSITPFYK